MGKKKGKKDKKGKGAEKTVLKTEKKADKKTKKMLKEKGEEDVEALIAEFQEKDRRRKEIIEEKVRPTPRSNMTLTAHPEKDELLMFGGEYFNGSKTFVYQDLYVYNIKTNTWTKLTIPNTPPPRCAHQAVAVRQGGGQLWVFGGEFSSPTQSQFYHYRDLWLLNLRERQWERINAPGGPSARSGHRMVAFKKLLLVFGGFHDNIRDYKYYNDMHAFNLETYSWMKLQLTGIPPAPRSACLLAVSTEPSLVMVYGGYSKEKVKRDVDQGKVHTDMFMLTPEGKCKQENCPVSWKWVSMKQSGVRPSPRCGCTLAVTPGNRAVVFGGVHDQEEDEEELEGVFYNEMYSLEVDRGKWHEVILRGKKEGTERRKRRRKEKTQESRDQDNDDADSESEGDDDDDDDELMEEEVKKLKMTEESQTGATEMESKEDDVFQVKIGAQSASSDPGVFTVTVGPQSSSTDPVAMDTQASAAAMETELFVPSPRMNALLTVKNGQLYLYGGIFEEGDRQFTLSDFYCLDLHKLDEWKTLIESDHKSQEWQESDSSDDDEEEDEEDEEMKTKSKRKALPEGATAGDEEEDDEDNDEEEEEEESEDDEEDEEMDIEENVPSLNSGEDVNEYFSRTQEVWLSKAEEVARKEGLKVKPKQMLKAAKKMAEEFHLKNTSS